MTRLAIVSACTALLLMSPARAQLPDGDAAEQVPVRSAPTRDGSEAVRRFQQRQQERYQGFQERRQADYEAYMERLRAQYERFIGIVEQVEAEERDRLATRWSDPELSSQKVWVEYSDDLAERRKVDFERGELTIESFSGDLDANDRAVLRDRLREIVTRNRAEAFEADRVAQAVERRSLVEIEDLATAEVTPAPVLWPYLTGEARVDPREVEAVVDFLVARAQIEEQRVAGERMQSVRIPLDTGTLLAQLEKLESGGFAAQMPDYAPQEIPRPSLAEPRTPGDTKPKAAPPPRTAPRVTPSPRLARPERQPEGGATLPVRARPFLPPVERHGGARELDPALVFSIIETESAFNPLARSHVPAFGLMQIVPRSAGQDATAVLFGKPRILAPSYLYDSDKNIEIGAIYLDILFNRYLSGIRDERSRLYCVIAAYNTGAGNVFRAFTGRTKSREAYRRINELSPEQVYRHLIWNLPYKETRQYLARVVDRMDKYRIE